MLPFLLTATFIYGEWDPQYCVDEESSILERLEDQKFKELKSQVIGYLENSWCSKEKATLLMDLTMMTQPTVCVEVGAFIGSSVLPVAATLKHIGRGKVYAIDAWSNTEAVKFLSQDDPNRAWWSTVDMKGALKSFKAMIAKWSLKPYCKVISSSSSAAIDKVGSIDFLHLDGDYSEMGSLDDVKNYLPKVKQGGYILFSNLFTMVNGTQPKLKAFCLLSESCELIAEIENDNAVLFRKR